MQDVQRKTEGLQEVNYRYNIRGWLTAINDITSWRAEATPSQDDLFAFQIRYDQPKTAKTTVANVQDLYNGNISETFWRTQTDNTERGYVYRYDPLNRITDAYYVKNGQAPGFYNITGITYDANGNIYPKT